MMTTSERVGNGKGTRFVRGSDAQSVVVKVPLDDYKTLLEIATGEERTVSAHVRYLIRRELERYKGKP